MSTNIFAAMYYILATLHLTIHCPTHSVVNSPCPRQIQVWETGKDRSWLAAPSAHLGMLCVDVWSGTLWMHNLVERRVIEWGISLSLLPSTPSLFLSLSLTVLPILKSTSCLVLTASDTLWSIRSRLLHARMIDLQNSKTVTYSHTQHCSHSAHTTQQPWLTVE